MTNQYAVKKWEEDAGVELQWTIEGKRFRSEEEYEAAKRDKQLIDSIIGNLKLDRPQDIEKLYEKLRSGKYRFETIVGRQFDDNIYELYKQIKQEEARKEEEKKNQERERLEKRQKAKQAVKNFTHPDKKAFKDSDKKHGKVSLNDFDKDMQKEILLELRKKEKKRKMLIAMCIPVCIICFGYLIFYYHSAGKSTSQFEELAQLKGSNTGNISQIHRTSEVQEGEREILDEYKALYNKNKKLIGWIKIDDTVIDYPVMQTVNNEYYLNHNFNQEEDKNGCIFMDCKCDVVKGCDNIILYGHHMQSGKMFGTLNKYSQEAYFKEHPRIQFDTIYEKGEYEVMYVFRSKVYSEEDVTFKYYQFINAGSEKEFNSYMNEMAVLSLYDTGVTAVYGDRLLTLSTCDYQENQGRFVVVAKRVN